MKLTHFMLIAGILLSAGCGRRNDPLPELVPVTGVVTLNGAPLPKANVTFHPLTSGDSSFGRTNEKGEFTLLYRGNAAGAVAGNHRVEIRTREEIVDRDGNLVSDQPELLPARYHDKTTLTADVHPGGPEIRFELKSK